MKTLAAFATGALRRIDDPLLLLDLRFELLLLCDETLRALSPIAQLLGLRVHYELRLGAASLPIVTFADLLRLMIHHALRFHAIGEERIEPNALRSQCVVVARELVGARLPIDACDGEAVEHREILDLEERSCRIRHAETDAVGKLGDGSALAPLRPGIARRIRSLKQRPVNEHDG